MQISNSNSPTFNAKIKFVDTKKFADYALDNYFYCAHPYQDLADSMIVGKKFWTSEVKSCTAGGIVGKEETLGLHIYDCHMNVRKVATSFVRTVKEKIVEPISAFIMGSKDIPSAPDSVPLYKEVAKQTKKMVTPSEFETFANKFSEADIGYIRESDTWLVNAVSLENPMLPINRTEIETVNDLKSMFKSIKIAPQDRLFIGEKEVLVSEHPELFLR